MRSKEDAQDYRYFPEPDLVPIVISQEWIDRVKKRQPEFREEKLKRYKKEFDIPQYDAEILTESKHMADIFEETTAICGKPKKVSNWLMVETMRLLKEHGMEPENTISILFCCQNGRRTCCIRKNGRNDRNCSKHCRLSVCGVPRLIPGDS